MLAVGVKRTAKGCLRLQHFSSAYVGSNGEMNSIIVSGLLWHWIEMLVERKQHVWALLFQVKKIYQNCVLQFGRGTRLVTNVTRCSILVVYRATISANTSTGATGAPWGFLAIRHQSSKSSRIIYYGLNQSGAAVFAYASVTWLYIETKLMIW